MSPPPQRLVPSVDDALMLIPSHFRDWTIKYHNGAIYVVELCIPSHEVRALGRTLPLAIYAAALRAIAEEGEV